MIGNDKSQEKDLNISEEIPIELLQKGFKISDKEVKEHSYLELEEIEGNLLNNNKLTINAKGLDPGLRAEEDGIVFFGTGEKTSNGKYKNDFILNTDPNYSPNIPNPHIFTIYYRRDLQNYYIDNFDENRGKYFIFVLLENPHPINEDEDVLISVLDYNFKLSVDKTTKALIVQYGQGDNLEKATFTKEKKNKHLYLLGRKSECDLVINDPSFSREQSMFIYDSLKQCWFIKDGGIEALSRTGTWLFVDKPYCIKNNITFKLGPSLMKIGLHHY